MNERYEDSYLYRLRHSAAHLMAQAVTELYPGAKLSIGPPVENGFYYDIEFPSTPREEDLAKIEKRIKELSKLDQRIQRIEVSRDEAKSLILDEKIPGMGADVAEYKLQLLDAIPAGETISFYDQQRTDREGTLHRFLDLCRGPHVDSTKEIKHVKLMSIAGAYWRGDVKNKQLTRIYGTAFESAEDLEAYLHMLEEAAKRDHRKLGKELGLFFFSEDVGPGLPLFTPKGEWLRYAMESFVRETQTKYGFQHVWTGHMVKEQLYHRSGHYENYSDVMFPPMIDEGVAYRLKPMNCPSHMTLFKEMGLHSYRELPMRFAEFATLYRYEPAGTLSGLTRVRSLTQDDCHVFCTPDQIQQEFSLCLELIREVLAAYQLTDYRVQLSLPAAEGKFVRDDEKWSKAIAALKLALDANGVAYEAVEGEAAFYGPKADFMAKDALGREWQLSTIQIDFIQPARLGVEYIGEDGQPHTPVLIHRAVTGSTERFMGVMIEHFAGAFPAWLAPVQAMIIPISDEKHGAYGRELKGRFEAAGLRVEIDESKDRMQAKIRRAQLQKVPYMLIIGGKEQEAGAVAVHLRNGEDLGAIPVADFVERARADIAAKI